VAQRSILTAVVLGLLVLIIVVACGRAGRGNGPVIATLQPASTPEPVYAGWTRRPLGGGGGQTGIAINPLNTSIVYVTTDNSGVVKSTDGGDTWFAVNNNLGNGHLGDIEMDPLNPDVLYVVAEVNSQSGASNDDPVTGELYRTRDGGQNWEIVYAEGMGNGDGRSFGIIQWPSTRNILIPYDPANPSRYDADGDRLTDVIYVGGWDEDEASADKRAGIWKSTDEGATFSQLALDDMNIWVLRQDPDQPETLYAGTYGDGLFVSRDGGEVWESWRDRIPIPTISDTAVVPNSNTLYVATNTFYSPYRADEYRDQRGLYKSTDGGASFFAVNTGLERTSLNFEVLILDRTDASGQTLYTGPWQGEDKGLYRTTNGGVHWTRMGYEASSDPYWLSSFANLWALEQARDGALFATTWRGIYRYDPASQEWKLKVKGLGNTAVRAIAFEPGNNSVVYLGILDSTPWKSLDKGMTWISAGRGFTTPDGRKTGASDFAVAPTQPSIVYATGIGSSDDYLSAVNKSEDGGLHWKPITEGLPPTSAEAPQWQANAIVVSAYDPGIAYVALEFKSGGGGIYKTTDGGRLWREIYAIPGQPRDLALTATQAETVVCVTSDGTVWVGAEGGSRWRSSSPEPGLIYSVAVFPTDANRIVVGTRTGAFLTADGGENWEHVFDVGDLQPFIERMALSEFARARYLPRIRVVKFDPANPRTLYLGHHASTWMGVGILKSVDGGQTWATLADDPFQMRSVNEFDLDPASHNLVVGSWEFYYYYADQP
jgi:photosystem II stability/assembly factor-like uncharacterized protein